MVWDPVCGMPVDPKTAPATAEYKGKTYYFCSMRCKEAFEREPERFVGSGRENPPGDG
jgi:P-type Cu+ transporter